MHSLLDAYKNITFNAPKNITVDILFIENHWPGKNKTHKVVPLDR